jgi:hypothetical protein
VAAKLPHPAWQQKSRCSTRTRQVLMLPSIPYINLFINPFINLFKVSSTIAQTGLSGVAELRGWQGCHSRKRCRAEAVVAAALRKTLAS